LFFQGFALHREWKKDVIPSNEVGDDAQRLRHGKPAADATTGSSREWNILTRKKRFEPRYTMRHKKKGEREMYMRLGASGNPPYR
jgi:hypothetical protein